ncbi:hypothetical protein EON67_03485, partial [archaeon]
MRREPSCSREARLATRAQRGRWVVVDNASARGYTLRVVRPRAVLLCTPGRVARGHVRAPHAHLTRSSRT